MGKTDWERIKRTEENEFAVLRGEVQLNTCNYLM